MRVYFLFLLIISSVLYAQQDTIIFNDNTLNYEIYYTGELFISEDSTKDTTVYFEFIPKNKFTPYFIFKLYEEIPKINKKNENNLLYFYGLRNDPKSKQGIRALRIYFNNFDKLARDVSFPYWKKWHRNNYFKWTALGGSLNPSFTEYGFIIESPNPPSIGKAFCEGYIEKEMQYPNDIFPKYQNMDEKINHLFMDHKYTGVTINTVVSGNLLASFTPSAFVDTLISYKHKAYDLGWIGNQGIINSLDKKLENAQKQIDKGNNKSARNILNAFLNELEALYKNHHITEKGGQGHGEGPPFITDEAYALLKYNAEYLIEQLEK